MLARLRVLARALLLRTRVEREVDDELRFHLERTQELFERRGLSPDDARRAAHREFGNVTVATESSRAAHRIQLLDDLMADARYAARALRRNPLFTTIAVLTIALGVGANTAIFGVVDAVLLRTLPVQDPDQLVFVRVVGSGGASFGGPPYPWFEQIRDRNRSFDAMAVFAVDQLPISVDGRAEQVLGQVASGAYFELLGVRPVIGRLLTRSDEQVGPPVAVIGYRYWQRRFGGRRDVVGTVIHYRDQPITIVGVTPRAFGGMEVGEQIDVTLPITLVGFDLLRDTGAYWSTTIARMKAGVTVERARQDAGAIFASLDVGTGARSSDPPQRHVELVSASRGLDRVRRQLATPLLLVLGAVGAVLLIGCANIANLLSVRAAARRRELAVRAALGAGGGRLARQLLTESVVLFSLGSALGLLVAKGVQRVVEGYLAVGRLPVELDLSLDVRMLAVTTLTALTAGLLAGLGPAVRAGRRKSNAFVDLRTAGDRLGGASAIGRSLVVVQVAISVVVLLGGSLFLRTLINLRSVDLGFRAERVLTVSIQPLNPPYPDDRRGAVFDEVLRRVRQLPEVESASLSVLTPLSGRDRQRGIRMPGFVPRSDDDDNVHVNYVSAGYFETLGIPITLGRAFTDGDGAPTPKVAVMNDAAARFYFGDRPALGTPITFEPSDEPRPTYSLVGVARGSRHRSIREDAPRFVFLPIGQTPDLPSRLTMTVKARSTLGALGTVITREVEKVGPNILVSDGETLTQHVDRALLQERLVSSLSVAFAVLGVLLCALGLYGVTAYAVVRRTPEIGIRMALGSTPRAVQWLMLRGALMLGVLGIAVGLPVGLGVATTLERLLYQIAPTDPVIAGMSVVVVVVVTALAGYVPARRASRTDPVRALAGQ
jgi:predicted permease